VFYKSLPLPRLRADSDKHSLLSIQKDWEGIVFLGESDAKWVSDDVFLQTNLFLFIFLFFI